MANLRQLSMSHQLLPKEEWTKPEDVGISLQPRIPDADNAKGHTIPRRAHHRDRVRDGRARGPRGHGHPEEAEERRPGHRTLECIYRVWGDQLELGGSSLRLRNRLYHTNTFRTGLPSVTSGNTFLFCPCSEELSRMRACSAAGICLAIHGK